MNAAQFRQKQKELLGEVQRQTGAAPTWTDQQLDSWRDSEISSLYSYGLFKVGSTRTLAGWTEPTVPTYTTGVRQRYFALPTTMKKVYKIEFVNATTDEVDGETYHFNDQEEDGFIRVDEATLAYEAMKLRLYGEIEYSTVDELPNHVADVAAHGSIIRALTGEYIQRQRSNRRRVSSRTTDASPGAIAAGIQVLTNRFNERLAHALSIQKTYSMRVS